jgi:ribonuclease BN (tRNA processing enzyme)
MTNTNTHTDASAVKDVQTYAKTKELILSYSHFSPNYKKIIDILDDVDVVRALGILKAATHLFTKKFEEIKQENS